MKGFDMMQATFYLVAGVFAVYSFAALFSLGSCIYLPTVDCKDMSLTEIFSSLLASALAFAAGQNSRNKE